MNTFVIQTISGEQRTMEAERYEINPATGCLDFFDEHDNKIKNPLFLIYGLESIEETQSQTEQIESSRLSASIGGD